MGFNVRVVILCIVLWCLTACGSFTNVPYRQRINYIGNNEYYMEVRQYGLQDARKLKLPMYRNMQAECDKFNVFDEYQTVHFEALKIWYNRDVNETIGGVVYSCRN
jgi:hypothetical protein